MNTFPRLKLTAALSLTILAVAFWAANSQTTSSPPKIDVDEIDVDKITTVQIPTRLLVIQDAAVREELKLSDQEQSKLQDLLMQYRQALRKMGKESVNKKAKSQAKPTSKAEQAKANRVYLAHYLYTAGRIAKAHEPKLDQLLGPEKARRLTQIQAQRAGYGAFHMPELADSLKFTQTQQASFHAIYEELAQALDRVSHSGLGRAEVIFQEDKLRAKAKDQVIALLTPGQKKIYQDFLGQPFNLKSLDANAPPQENAPSKNDINNKSK